MRLARAATGLAIALAACARGEAPAREAAAAEQPCPGPASTSVRLDHVPIAVRDLEAATAHYRDDLGFAIKPGRPHPNSILNSHPKFRDSTQIELITAAEPRDRLAADYLEFLESGDGAAFLAIGAGRVDRASEVVAAVEPEHEKAASEFGTAGFPPGHPLRYLFLVHGTPSPTDRPEHFEHPNTAAGLYAVWLSPPDPARQTRLLERLGGAACPATLLLPIGVVETEIRTAHGSLYLVPGSVPARRAVRGATIRVRSLDSARAAVRLPDGVVEMGGDERGRWIRIPPEHAHGVWLELLEPKEP